MLAAFDQQVRLVAVSPKSRLTCSDPDDQRFIDLAVQHRAPLLSKDKAVLAMTQRLQSLGVRVTRALDSMPL